MSSEKQIDAGMEVLFRLIADMQSAQAEGMRAATAIRAEIERSGFTIRPTADMTAITGTMRQTAKELERELQIERQANLRTQAALQEQVIMDQLRREVAAAKEVEKAKSTAEKRLEPLHQLDRELSAKRATPGMGIYRPEEDVSEANRRRSVRDFYEKQNNDALAKKAQSEEKATRQISNFDDTTKKAKTAFGEFAALFGSGGRPQRSFSQLATGMMQPILGETGGALAGGALGMVAGGMLFHIGWAITNALSKIPEAIGEKIDTYRGYEQLRAVAGTQEAPSLATMSTLTDKSEIEKKIKDAQLQGEVQAVHDFLNRRIGNTATGIFTSADASKMTGRYDAMLATLLREGATTVQATEFAKQSIGMELGHPLLGGKAESIALTRLRLAQKAQIPGGGADEIAALAATPAINDLLVKAESKEHPYWARKRLEEIVKAKSTGGYTNDFGGRIPGQYTPEDIQNLIGGPGTAIVTPEEERLNKQMQGQTNMWARWEENPIFRDYASRKPAMRQALDVLRDFTENKEVGFTPPFYIPGTNWKESHDAIRDYQREHLDQSGRVQVPKEDTDKVLKMLTAGSPGMQSAIRHGADELEKLFPAAAALGGAGLKQFYGIGDKPFETSPFYGNAKFFTQSNEGLQAKMQSMGGVSYDTAPGASTQDLTLAEKNIPAAAEDAQQANTTAIKELTTVAAQLKDAMSLTGGKGNSLTQLGSWASSLVGLR